MLLRNRRHTAIMFLLLTCLALSTLSTFSAHAKVVETFNDCNHFFYKGTEPKGMDQNAKKICQKRTGNTFLYATLYSVSNKIPLYSAYIFDSRCSGTSTKQWHLEPQLYSTDEPDHMMLEGDCNVDILKDTQALSSDYAHTGYDRGHLYPNSFQCGEKCKATFTLTNAAPMDACFNRVQWKIWEGYLQRFLKAKLDHGDPATVYIVTGTVPGKEKIPQEETCEDTQNIKRVTVPSHIWTAVCYKHAYDDSKSFSFGYIGKNQPEFNILLMRVSDINVQLDQLLYESSTPTVQIFSDDCFSDKPASEEANNQFFNQIKLPEHQRFLMSKGAQSKLITLQNVISSDDASSSAKKPKITELSANLDFDSSSSFFTSLEKLKKESRSACLLIASKKRRTSEQRDFRKRDVSEGSGSFECRLVPEKSVDKTAADGSPCTRFEDNGYACTCTTPGGQSKPCCSTPCLYQNQLKGYHCYSGWRQIVCSPQYSLIAIEGKRCRDDHPCATYGEDYYWCYTDESWEYCSPPLWGSRAKDGKFCRSDYACAKYNKEELWCYTDDVGNWNYCCTSDDCFSAVQYKTCKPDHPCGYHGENYLWCKTTDGSWDYCCRQCIY